ncbi:hypothetical protein IWW48_002024 [Coemansia sp. RSA 1200]|nr:hypothetical protein IWW48_002024 [Coemansia sp. RSA 1200]
MFARLQGKTVLITGASSGIGEACAYKFAESGSNLVLTARRQPRLDQVKTAIAARWPNVRVDTAELDVRDETAVKRCVAGIPRIDVLVNNAGLAVGTDPVELVRSEDMDAMIDTNVKGLLYVTRAVLGNMKKHGEEAHVIMIGSIASLTGYPNGSVYCATKSAVHAITESLRAETIATPVRVTEIRPGMVETEFSVVRNYGDTQKAANVYRGIEPMVAEDVADTAVFAASRHPRCVLADVVMLAGGQASATLVHRNE